MTNSQPKPSQLPSPRSNREQIVQDIHRILEQFYPEIPAVIAGLIYSRNRVVAEKISTYFGSIIKDERQYVEQQLLALYLAFKAGE